ncbi:MAG TPA: hypothetical protein VN963_06455, partial [bacterium]|nr:hypothetical protein [bacterium]
VEKLWADSPMGKAGVALGDMVWSLEKNAFYPPGRKKLEAGLNGLQPGPHALFIAANADFIKAQGDVSFKRAGSLNPKRASLIVEIPPMYPASLPKGPSPLDPRTEK